MNGTTFLYGQNKQTSVVIVLQEKSDLKNF